LSGARPARPPSAALSPHAVPRRLSPPPPPYSQRAAVNLAHVRGSVWNGSATAALRVRRVPSQSGRQRSGGRNLGVASDTDESRHVTERFQLLGESVAKVGEVIGGDLDVEVDGSGGKGSVRLPGLPRTVAKYRPFDLDR